MSVRLQVIILLMVLIELAAIVNMVRKGKIGLRYALPWLALGVGMILIDVFPCITDFLAELMGVALPINMLFFMGFCFLLIIIFLLTISVSKIHNREKQLAQELALLKKRMEEAGIGDFTEEK